MVEIDEPTPLKTARLNRELDEFAALSKLGDSTIAYRLQVFFLGGSSETELTNLVQQAVARLKRSDAGALDGEGLVCW